MISKEKAASTINNIITQLNHQLDEIMRMYYDMPDICYDVWSKGYVYGLINSFGVDRWYMEDIDNGSVKRLQTYLHIYTRVFGATGANKFSEIECIQHDSLTEPGSIYMKGYRTGLIDGFKVDLKQRRCDGWCTYVNKMREIELQERDQKQQADPSKYQKRNNRKVGE